MFKRFLLHYNANIFGDILINLSQSFSDHYPIILELHTANTSVTFSKKYRDTTFLKSQWKIDDLILL